MARITWRQVYQVCGSSGDQQDWMPFPCDNAVDALSVYLRIDELRLRDPDPRSRHMAVSWETPCDITAYQMPSNVLI
jgi:hypothetical protein